MKRSSLALAAAAALTIFATSSAMGAAIPYPDVGVYNNADYSFYAPASGDVTGYFDGSSAGSSTTVGLEINGSMTSAGFGLDNQSSTVGQAFDFGFANSGALLTFVFHNSVVAANAYSDPSLNVPFDTPGETEHNHIYSTTFAASGGIPSGTYIGFEDQRFPFSDYDYNDTSFVVTNANAGAPSVSAAPEPSAWALMVAGVGLVGAALRVSGSKRHFV